MLGRNFHYHAVVHQAHAYGRVYAANVCIAHSSDVILLLFSCAQVSLLFYFFRFYFVSYACPFGALLRFNALAFNYGHFYIDFVSVCAIARISDEYYLKCLNFWHIRFSWKFEIAPDFMSDLVLSVVSGASFLCTRQHFNHELETIRFVNSLENVCLQKRNKWTERDRGKERERE